MPLRFKQLRRTERSVQAYSLGYRQDDILEIGNRRHRPSDFPCGMRQVMMELMNPSAKALTNLKGDTLK